MVFDSSKKSCVQIFIGVKPLNLLRNQNSEIIKLEIVMRNFFSDILENSSVVALSIISINYHVLLSADGA